MPSASTSPAASRFNPANGNLFVAESSADLRQPDQPVHARRRRRCRRCPSPVRASRFGSIDLALQQRRPAAGLRRFVGDVVSFNAGDGTSMPFVSGLTFASGMTVDPFTHRVQILSSTFAAPTRTSRCTASRRSISSAPAAARRDSECLHEAYGLQVVDGTADLHRRRAVRQRRHGERRLPVPGRLLLQRRRPGLRRLQRRQQRDRASASPPSRPARRSPPRRRRSPPRCRSAGSSCVFSDGYYVPVTITGSGAKKDGKAQAEGEGRGRRRPQGHRHLQAGLPAGAVTDGGETTMTSPGGRRAVGAEERMGADRGARRSLPGADGAAALQRASSAARCVQRCAWRRGAGSVRRRGRRRSRPAPTPASAPTRCPTSCSARRAAPARCRDRSTSSRSATTASIVVALRPAGDLRRARAPTSPSSRTPFTAARRAAPIFAEYGIVAVSQDGANFVELPYDAVTHAGWPGRPPVLSHPDNGIDPLDPTVSGGDTFDLAAVGLAWAAYVRITDPGAAIPDPGNMIPPGTPAPASISTPSPRCTPAIPGAVPSPTPTPTHDLPRRRRRRPDRHRDQHGDSRRARAVARCRASSAAVRCKLRIRNGSPTATKRVRVKVRNADASGSLPIQLTVDRLRPGHRHDASTSIAAPPARRTRSPSAPARRRRRVVTLDVAAALVDDAGSAPAGALLAHLQRSRRRAGQRRPDAGRQQHHRRPERARPQRCPIAWDRGRPARIGSGSASPPATQACRSALVRRCGTPVRANSGRPPAVPGCWLLALSACCASRGRVLGAGSVRRRGARRSPRAPTPASAPTQLPGIVLGPPRGAGLDAGIVRRRLARQRRRRSCMRFDLPVICDGPGADFTVFENAFHAGSPSGPIFAEYGIVAVSQDGEHFVDLPYDADHPRRAGRPDAGAQPSRQRHRSARSVRLRRRRLRSRRHRSHLGGVRAHHRSRRDDPRSRQPDPAGATTPASTSTPSPRCTPAIRAAVAIADADADVRRPRRPPTPTATRPTTPRRRRRPRSRRDRDRRAADRDGDRSPTPTARPIVPGDLDGDGSVTAADAALLIAELYDGDGDARRRGGGAVASAPPPTSTATAASPPPTSPR